jgi:mRNA-degrading endonuclease RelE of RelBE toxin-antitoxin system
VDVIYLLAVVKVFKSMPRADVERLRAAFMQVAESHPARMPFVTELVGGQGTWRLRKGDYRALYRIEGDTLVVFEVGRRGEIYR